MNKKKTLISVAIVVAIAGGIYAFAQGSSSEEFVGIDMAVTTVSRSTLASTITAQGEVALTSSETAFITNSLEVTEVFVRENDVVSAGDPLVSFNANMRDRERERDRLNTQLRDTRLVLQSQEVSLENLRLGPAQIEIENARSNISRAEQSVRDAEFNLEQIQSNIVTQERAVNMIRINLADAMHTLNTTTTLFDIGAATQNQLDTALRAVENIEAEIVNGTERITQLEAQIRQAEQAIIVAEDNVRLLVVQLEDLENRVDSPQNQNAIAQQEIAIARTRIAIEDIQRSISILNDVESMLYAPISGTVTRVNIVRGAIATAGQPLIEISDTDSFVLRAFVNERHAGQLNLGQSVLIEGSILGNDVIEGKISSISTVAVVSQVSGVAERTVPVEITIDNSDILIPGVTLDVTITTDVRENVIAIPILSTLSQRDGDSFVFVVGNDGLLTRRYVEIITYADMYVEVEGLSEGEIIILQPQHNMVDMTEEILINPIMQ